MDTGNIETPWHDFYIAEFIIPITIDINGVFTAVRDIKFYREFFICLYFSLAGSDVYGRVRILFMLMRLYPERSAGRRIIISVSVSGDCYVIPACSTQIVCRNRDILFQSIGISFIKYIVFAVYIIIGITCAVSQGYTDGQILIRFYPVGNGNNRLRKGAERCSDIDLHPISYRRIIHRCAHKDRMDTGGVETQWYDYIVAVFTITIPITINLDIVINVIGSKKFC